MLRYITILKNPELITQHVLKSCSIGFRAYKIIFCCVALLNENCFNLEMNSF